jgi:hypothetical protein
MIPLHLLHLVVPLHQRGLLVLQVLQLPLHLSLLVVQLVLRHLLLMMHS